jgi:hypothetical protein
MAACIVAFVDLDGGCSCTRSVCGCTWGVCAVRGEFALYVGSLRLYVGSLQVYAGSLQVYAGLLRVYVAILQVHVASLISAHLREILVWIGAIRKEPPSSFDFCHEIGIATDVLKSTLKSPFGSEVYGFGLA